jgi:hypothetical protein
MSREALQIYSCTFHNVHIIFVQKVACVHVRHQEMTNKFENKIFGGINIVFCGDLKQLPPFSAHRDPLSGAAL